MENAERGIKEIQLRLLAISLLQRLLLLLLPPHLLMHWHDLTLVECFLAEFAFYSAARVVAFNSSASPQTFCYDSNNNITKFSLKFFYFSHVLLESVDSIHHDWMPLHFVTDDSGSHIDSNNNNMYYMLHSNIAQQQQQLRPKVRTLFFMLLMLSAVAVVVVYTAAFVVAYVCW